MRRILNVTHQGTARDAASVHFRPSITRTGIFFLRRATEVVGPYRHDVYTRQYKQINTAVKHDGKQTVVRPPHNNAVPDAIMIFRLYLPVIPLYPVNATDNPMLLRLGNQQYSYTQAASKRYAVT